MTKYNINYNQTGGRLMVTKLRPSVCEQASNIINYLLGSLFTPQNSSMWHGTDFYHLFGNEVAVLNMNLYQFEYMISSIEHMHRDASYSAKIHMIKYILDELNILRQSLKFISSDYSIKSVRDVANLKINCASGHLPQSYRRNIKVKEYINSNRPGGPGGPGSSIFFSSPPVTPSISSVNIRCVYRDPTCIGDRDVITLEDINKSNLNNVVKVDKKCYDADELQKWLVNNDNLPHNRQRYTSKELNECVEGRKTSTVIPLSSSSSSLSSTVMELLTPSISPNIYPQTITPFQTIQDPTYPYYSKNKKFLKKYIFEDDLFNDEDEDIIENTDSNYISSYNNRPRKKKKSSKKKSSKKKSSKKKSSKKKSSKKNRK